MAWLKVETDAEALDIDGMRDASPEFYEEYIRETLFLVDHHDVLRSNFGEYPIAVTKDQMKTLIKFLQETAERME